jgi:phage/plasmid primase-like uncharacterized protein
MTFEQARAVLHHQWGWKDSDRHARCPAHGGRGRNLSAWADPDGYARFKCWSHGCATRDILRALDAPAEPRSPVSGPRPKLDDKPRSELALEIWREARPAAGTLVEAYLRARGITIAPTTTLRFHSALRHPSATYAPALVAAVEHMRSGNALIAVHRTWLRADGGGKAAIEPAKAALGPIAGGAVRLGPAGATLVVAEGIETGLSVMQATGLPVWAALGTANLTRVELPEMVCTAIIATDADDPGERAALVAAHRFLREGRRTKIARPTRAKDFNEMRL